MYESVSVERGACAHAAPHPHYTPAETVAAEAEPRLTAAGGGSKIEDTLVVRMAEEHAAR